MPGKAEAPNNSDFLTDLINGAQELLSRDSRVTEAAQKREIPIPAFIPDSYLRSRSKNLYLNMLNAVSANGVADNHLKFFEESSGGSSFKDKIKSALSSALGSVTTLVTNQVGAIANTAQGVVDSIGGALGLTDSTEKDNFGSEDVDNFPMIEVYGFNVTPPVTQTLEIIKQSISVVKSICTSDDGFGDFFKKLKDALIASLTEFGLVENGKISGAQAVVEQHGIAERFILNAAAGVYKLKTKIPLLKNERPFLTSESSGDNWQGGLTASNGGQPGSIQNILAETMGLNLAISPQLKWIASGLNRCSPVKTTFTLFNDTIDHLTLNYIFIMGFCQTAMPTTGGILLKSPFLYDIVLPNGLKYYSCTCDFSIKCKGRNRILSSHASSNTGNSVGYKNILPTDSSHVIGRFITLQKNKQLFFPDAYEVEITFTSLLPDTWNFISGWLTDSKGTSNPTLGTEKHVLLTKVIKAFSDAMKPQGTTTTKVE